MTGFHFLPWFMIIHFLLTVNLILFGRITEETDKNCIRLEDRRYVNSVGSSFETTMFLYTLTNTVRRRTDIIMYGFIHSAGHVWVISRAINHLGSGSQTLSVTPHYFFILKPFLIFPSKPLDLMWLLHFWCRPFNYCVGVCLFCLECVLFIVHKQRH